MGTTGQKDDSYPRCEKVDGTKFHHTTQNVMQFKIYGLFISGIFNLKILDCS